MVHNGMDQFNKEWVHLKFDYGLGALVESHLILAYMFNINVK